MGPSTSVTDPAATVTGYGYDAEANETTTTYSNQGAQTKTQIEYNEAGAVKREIDQFEATATTRSYDESGKETTLTQPMRPRSSRPTRPPESLRG